VGEQGDKKGTRDHLPAVSLKPSRMTDFDYNTSSTGLRELAFLNSGVRITCWMIACPSQGTGLLHYEGGSKPS
jgi:DNA gyrase/topoisomerase IV subunit B